MNTVDGYKENNIMILSLMRLADVYLMYAEATAVGYNGPYLKITDVQYIHIILIKVKTQLHQL